MFLLRNQIITYTNFPKKCKCCVIKEINDKFRYLQTIEMIWEKKNNNKNKKNKGRVHVIEIIRIITITSTNARTSR